MSAEKDKDTKSDMTLEKFRNVSNGFEKEVRVLKLRWIGNVIVYLSFVGTIVFLISLLNQKKMQVIDSATGNVYEAKQKERTDWSILKIDADAHARHFYGTMWTFDHNNIDKQVEKASTLGGNVISDLYKVLLESGYYNDVRSNGYYVTSEIDSVDQKTFGYRNGLIYMKIYGTQKLTNNVFVEIRKIDMEMEMRIVDRILTRNPSGMSIEYLNILSNETVSKERKEY